MATRKPRVRRRGLIFLALCAVPVILLTFLVVGMLTAIAVPTVLLLRREPAANETCGACQHPQIEPRSNTVAADPLPAA